MAISVHNTLTRRAEPFVPLQPGKVGMYLCGPTVYDDCHIGHLMGPVLFDAVARWFRARGFAVAFVNNITDIDDKILDRAARTGEAWTAITARYTEQYLGLLNALKVTSITDHPRATAFVEPMVAFVAELERRGVAYRGPDGVYFDISRQPGYGKLSGRKAEDKLAGARIDRDGGLRNPGDFCLWKLAKPGEPSWPSPWGAGRPGWHIECSVMAGALLGPEFDIHGGGDDLKFPHHENEVAQSEAHGHAFARCWMHNGLVQYEGAKVAKSDPRNADPAFARQFQALHLISTYGGAVIRFLFLQGHYRRPVDFAPQHIEAARTALQRLHAQLGGLLDEPAGATLDEILARPADAEAAARREAFVAAMDDDFNTGVAVAQLFALAAHARKADEAVRPTVLRLLRDLGRLIGLLLPGDARDTGAAPVVADDATVQGLMSLILDLRARARAAKDYATSDLVRDRLAALGIAVKDGKDGATWSRKA